MKKDTNPLRTKMRSERVTIDGKMLGKEPAWNASDIPTEDGQRKIEYIKAASWYNYDHKPKDFVPYVFQYAKDLGYKDSDIKAMKKLPDWRVSNYLGKLSKILSRGWVYTPEEIEVHKKEFNTLIAEGKRVATQVEDKPAVISPAERTKNNLLSTVVRDWDLLVDEWCKGNYKVEFNAYNLFKNYGLKANAVGYFDGIVRPDYELLYDAYHKKCEQAMEAYAHVTRPFQKKMLQLMESIFNDLESIKAASKQTRLPRAKKPKASDKQVAKLKYKQEDVNSKLVSINPVMIPGQSRLYTYNVKTRKLTEYVCTSVGGFLVHGTSIKNFDASLSRTATLRKPEDVLPIVMKKSATQIDKAFNAIKTKVSVPNGRINEDTILLRVVT